MSAALPTSIHRRVAALNAGTDPAGIARLASGWAVLGDPQVIRGYCLLLPDPVVPDLNALRGEARAAFLADMARLGDALIEVMAATRVNYAIFGNVDPALHAHVFPRRADEPAALVTVQPFGWNWDAAPKFDAALHAPLIERIRAVLARPPGSGRR